MHFERRGWHGLKPVALLLACGASRGFGQTESPPRTDADRQILDEAGRIEEEIARLRGRSFVRAVAKQVYTRAQLGDFLKQQFADPDNQKEIEHERIWLTAVGYLPQEVDLKALYQEMLQSQIAGFYDPKDRTLRCISSDIALVQRLTMVHEIYHSLQDQYVALEPWMKAAGERTDASRARQAVVEGDAQYFTMTHYSAAHALEFAKDLTSQSRTALLGFGLEQLLAQSSIPPYFVDQLTWPYVDGAKFIGALYEAGEATDAGGWAMVDRAFKEPPASSEQIIHPEKYLHGDDPPIAVRARIPSFAAAWPELLRDTRGEAAIATLLRHLTGDVGHALRGSQGWGGDEAVVLRSPNDEELLVWRTSWDSGRDADQFYVAWRRAAQKTLESSSENATRSSCFFAELDHGTHRLVSSASNFGPVPDRLAEAVILPPSTTFFFGGGEAPTSIACFALKRDQEVVVLRGPIPAGSARELAMLARELIALK